MNRRIACMLLMGCLAGLLFLRETPVVFLGVVAVFAAGGRTLLGRWREDDKAWHWLMGAGGFAWIAARSVAAGELTANFVAEALLFSLATECVRVPDWNKPIKRVPIFGGITLVATMYQRVLFEYLGWFCLLGILCVVAIAWLSAQDRMGQRFGFMSRRISTTLAILGVAGFTSFEASQVWGEQLSAMENRIDIFLSNFVSDSIPTLYPRTGTLNSINMEKTQNPTDVAIRVYSRKAPGYMTGRVFDSFVERSLFWRMLGPEVRYEKKLDRMHIVRPTQAAGIRVPKGQSLFQVTRQEPSRRWATYEIENTSGRGEMVFTPQGSQYVRGYGRVLRTDDYGVVHSGLNCESVYMAYADPTAKGDAPGPLTELLLSVPQKMRAELTELAGQLSEGNETFEAKVKATRRYFSKDFLYTTRSPRPPRGKHFLSWFVKENKEGHCEMFATATVMLLRLQGLPSRYVTGYVIRNRDPEDTDYFAALNQDCHAWAEVWNEDEQRWAIVETTPGMSREQDDVDAEFDGEASLADMFEEGGGGDGSTIATYGWVKVVQWTGLLAFAALLAWSWFRFADRTKKRGAANVALVKLDKRLGRKGLKRNPGETLSEFADRVEGVEDSQLSPAFLAKAASFYRDYAESLYGGNEEQLAALALPV